jgi:CBS domain-containing protein
MFTEDPAHVCQRCDDTLSLCCKPTDTLDRVAALMLEHDCCVIPVCEATKLVGIITDRDITCRSVATGKIPWWFPRAK